jgi:hypothetical protein
MNMTAAQGRKNRWTSVIAGLASLCFLTFTSGLYLRYHWHLDDWQSHPALSPPDGESHRGDKRLPPIRDQRILDELSRRFRGLQGEDDFEVRQEYFLRLLDHYLFEKNRLVGMTRQEVESIFGLGTSFTGLQPGRLMWDGGRDSLFVDVEKDRVTQAGYVMGY